MQEKTVQNFIRNEKIVLAKLESELSESDDKVINSFISIFTYLQVKGQFEKIIYIFEHHIINQKNIKLKQELALFYGEALFYKGKVVKLKDWISKNPSMSTKPEWTERIEGKRHLIEARVFPFKVRFLILACVLFLFYILWKVTG
jgi:hypothetical protein